jgi:hypothetical protein
MVVKLIFASVEAWLIPIELREQRMAPVPIFQLFPQSLKLTEVALLLRDVPLFTFVSVGIALNGSREAKEISESPKFCGMLEEGVL